LSPQDLAVRFEQFRSEFHPFAVKQVGEDLAGDVFQETFLTASEQLPKFQDRHDGKALFGWLYQILWRKCSEKPAPAWR